MVGSRVGATFLAKIPGYDVCGIAPACYKVAHLDLVGILKNLLVKMLENGHDVDIVGMSLVNHVVHFPTIRLAHLLCAGCSSIAANVGFGEGRITSFIPTARPQVKVIGTIGDKLLIHVIDAVGAVAP